MAGGLLRRALTAGALVWFARETRAQMETCPDYVANHGPLIWLHSDDPYLPSDIAAHIQHTTPQLDGKPIEHLPPLGMDNLEILTEYGEDVALTSRDDPLSLPSWLLGEAPDEDGRIRNSKPCVVVLVPRGKNNVDAFYFYFYSYNEGMNITQVLPPLDQLVDSDVAQTGIHFGNHVADWEHNMIRFEDGKPTGIWYSQHRWGEAFRWNNEKLTIENGRPTVYSARGSHANYAWAGHHVQLSAMFDFCDEGRRWDPLLSADFYQLDPDDFSLARLNPPEQLGLAEPTSNLTSFFYYEGRWGDHEYPLSDPRQMLIKRFSILRFETGPNGPRFKGLIRRSIEPDEKYVATWTEWGVYYFMRLYPCCIRGWRKWVSLGLIVVVVSLLIVAVVLWIKRLRVRMGRKSPALGDEEGILLNDWEDDAEGLLSSDDELQSDSDSNHDDDDSDGERRRN